MRRHHSESDPGSPDPRPPWTPDVDASPRKDHRHRVPSVLEDSRPPVASKRLIPIPCCVTLTGTNSYCPEHLDMRTDLPKLFIKNPGLRGRTPCHPVEAATGPPLAHAPFSEAFLAHQRRHAHPPPSRQSCQ
jgi:hypothetical protein